MKDNQNPENIENYIEKGIADYRWSDDFMVKDLVKKGYAEEEARRLVAKVKRERGVSNKDHLFSEYIETKDTGKVHGGLAMVMVFAVLKGFVSVLSPLLKTELDGSLACWLESGLLSGLLLLLLSLYAMLQGMRKKPNAVFLLKAFLVLAFFSNVLELVVDFGTNENGNMRFRRLMSGCVAMIVSFLYMCTSDQVRQLFPKSQRRVYLRDWLLVASTFAILSLTAYSIFSAPHDYGKDLERYVGVMQRRTDAPSLRVAQRNERQTTYALDRDSIVVICQQQLKRSKDMEVEMYRHAEELFCRQSLLLMTLDSMGRDDSLRYYMTKTGATLRYSLLDAEGGLLYSLSISPDEMGKPSGDDKKVYGRELARYHVTATRKLLPKETEHGLTWTDIQMDEEKNEMVYNFKVKRMDFINEVGYDTMSRILQVMYIDVTDARELGMDLRLVYMDRQGKELRQSVLHPKDYNY